MLYKNKSLNSPGFLLAALLNEGVVEKEAGKRLLFRTCPDDAFLAEMQELMDAEIDVTDAAEALGSVASSGGIEKSVSAISAVAKSHTATKKTARGSSRKTTAKTAKSLFPAS